MSRAPARSREAMAVRMTSAGSRSASSAACRVRNSHRAWCESGCRWPGGSAASDQLAVAVVAGGLSFGGPDRVEDTQVIGVGQVALPDRAWRKARRRRGPGRRRARRSARAGPPGPAVRREPVLARYPARSRRMRSYRSSSGAGRVPGGRVGGPGRGGEHERQVGVGAAGHRRVQPLPVLGAGDERDARCARWRPGRSAR